MENEKLNKEGKATIELMVADGIISRECAEKYFPEIKESEGERIRKEMIFYFTEEMPQCSIQEHSNKMREFISWLKRQEVECTKLELKAGNSYFCYKSRWERADNEIFKKGLIYKCNKDGVLDNFVIKNPEQHFIEIKDERIAWLEAHGEQKPAEWSEKYIADVFEKVGLVKIVREQGNDALTEALQSAMIELAKYSVVPQSKQEWSKEDNDMMRNIIDDIYCGTNFNPEVRHAANERAKWFKSICLKYQSR